MHRCRLLRGSSGSLALLPPPHNVPVVHAPRADFSRRHLGTDEVEALLQVVLRHQTPVRRCLARHYRLATDVPTPLSSLRGSSSTMMSPRRTCTPAWCWPDVGTHVCEQLPDTPHHAHANTHPEPQKYAVAGLHLGFRVDVVLQVEVRLERLICLLLLAQELDHLQGTLQLRHLLFQGTHLGQNVALQNAVLAEHNGDDVSAKPSCTPSAHTKGNRAARYVLLHLRQLGNHLIEPDWALLHEGVNVVLCTVVHAHKPSTHTKHSPSIHTTTTFHHTHTDAEAREHTHTRNVSTVERLGCRWRAGQPIRHRTSKRMGG